MRLALLGRGRMGREVAAAAEQRGHEIVVRLDGDSNAGGAGITTASFSGVDAAVDFSRPTAVPDNVDAATGLGVPLVIGTTGWADRLEAMRSLVIERHGAAVYGANFSIGANLFIRLAEHAARLFDPFDDYDPYVFEHHHRDKADAPSGTALRVAELVSAASSRKSTLQTGNPAGAIDRRSLHVSSLRAGSAFGEHRVGFDGSADALQLIHTARGRRGFANGALLAAQWIVGKRGFFEFSEVLDDMAGGAAEDHAGGPPGDHTSRAASNHAGRDDGDR